MQHDETMPGVNLNTQERKASFSERSERLISHLKKAIPKTFPEYFEVSETSEVSRQRLISFHRMGLVLDVADKDDQQVEEMIKKGPQFFEVMERIGQQVGLNEIESNEWNKAIGNARKINWKAYDRVVSALDMNDYKGEGIGHKVFSKAFNKIGEDDDLETVDGYLSLLGY